MKKYLIPTIALSLFLSFSVNAKEVVKLPDPNLSGGKPLMEAMKARQTGRDFSTKAIDDQTLSEILWAAWGITHDGKRTIPTSQNKQNMEVYVVKADGAWKYDAKKNQLTQIVDKDLRSIFATQEYVNDAPITLVFSGTDRTNTPLHAGSAYQNVGLYCASKGLVNVVRAWFDMDEATKALKLPKGERVVVSHTIGWGK